MTPEQREDLQGCQSGGNPSHVEARLDQIRDQIAKTTSEYEKEKLQERLARPSSGVVAFKISGSSEMDPNEKRSRLEQAFFIFGKKRKATQEGYLSGIGRVLYHLGR